VDFNWNTATVVVYANRAVFTVDVDFDMVHVGVAHFVVGRVHQDFIKDLVKTRDNFDFPSISLARFSITCKPSSPYQSRRPTYSGSELQWIQYTVN
jgi:hypothetical protein